MPPIDRPLTPISVDGKYVIAEALLNFFEAESSPSFVRALEAAQARYPRFLALVRFEFEVEVAHSIESGSVKSKVTVLAILTALIQGIEHYGDFRDGIDRIFEDAKHFAVQANEYILFSAHPHTNTPVIFETRTGLVGALKRFKDDVQFLNEHADDISPSEMKSRLKRLASETDQMFKEASSQADFGALTKLLSDTSRQIVRSNEYPFEHDYPYPSDPFRYPMISPNRRELDIFLDLLRQRTRER
jgi:hypothetical protein